MKKEKKRYWIARDEDNELMLYTQKPFKDYALGIWKIVTTSLNENDPGFNLMKITDGDLPIIGHNPQWTDEEPVEVELNITIVYREGGYEQTGERVAKEESSPGESKG